MKRTFDYHRREFLLALGSVGACAFAQRGSQRGRPAPAKPSPIRAGYAAITWGGHDEQAIDEIAQVGFKGIQLRASAVNTFGTRPADLRALLDKRGLTFIVLSSGDLGIDPAVEREQLDLHTEHAKFVRDSGGLFIQVIDERPKGRPIVADDYKRLGGLMSELGRRTAAIGVPLVYHHHMNSLGEKPEEIDAVLAASDPASVALLLDIAHYHQAGGDPVAAIARYHDRIRLVHLKDVITIPEAPGYRFVELGRGRVHVKESAAALAKYGFAGWAIVELDRVSDPAGSPKASAEANREYVVQQLGLSL
jgi:inosose dehydratase